MEEKKTEICIETYSAEETLALGEELGRKVYD